MKIWKRLSLMLFALALIAVTSLPAMADDKGEIELAYVEWSSEVASANVVKAGLEKLGYDVELTSVSVGPMYVAVAAGDVDGTVASWQPLQKANLKAMGDRLVNLGPNMVGVQSGLVVPDYVAVDTIPQLNDVPDRFDETIIGIDPGAGIMQQTDQAMKVYNLKEYELMDSTGAMMTAALKDCIRQEKWCVVTGWTPHWMWGVWDLKYLDDPENVYGKAEDGTILTLVRKGLKADKPEAYRFLDNFHWTPGEMAEVMVWIKKGMDPDEAGEKFIEKYPGKFKAWAGK